MLDTRTPHYWDPKRLKLIRGVGELDDDKGYRVLVDTIGNRKYRRLTDGFAKTLDPKDAKLVMEAVKGSFDKFNRLLQKRADLKKEWITYAGNELMEAAIDWLAMQGIDEFIATGEIAKFAIDAPEEEPEEESDDDEEEEEESEDEESEESEEESEEDSEETEGEADDEDAAEEEPDDDE
jgi:cobalamin biosynthesis protein CobT